MAERVRRYRYDALGITLDTTYEIQPVDQPPVAPATPTGVLEMEPPVSDD